MSNYNNFVEGYDARYTDLTIDDCAKFCKIHAGCYGVAFDPKNKICYPAKDVLTGPPYDSLYENQYKPDNVQCNKVNGLKEPTEAPTFDEMKSNATFSCKERVELQPQLYLHDQGKLNYIEEGQNPDFILEIDEYKVYPYRWPVSPYDADQLDLLQADREKQNFTEKTVTMMDRVRAAEPDPIVEEEIIAEEQPKTIPETIIDNIKDYQKVIGVDLNSILEGFNSVPQSMDKTYEVYDKLNQGAYLRNHKCIRGIPLKGCLNYCSENVDCVGVEHNPLFFDKKNVCCPYKSSDLLIPRLQMHINGKYYKKINPQLLSSNKENIHIIM